MFENFLKFFEKEKDIRIVHAENLIKELKRYKKIEGIYNKEVLQALKIIANTPNWQKEIDENTLNLIETFYQQKKEFLQRKKENAESPNKFNEYIVPLSDSSLQDDVTYRKEQKRLQEEEAKRRREEAEKLIEQEQAAEDTTEEPTETDETPKEEEQPKEPPIWLIMDEGGGIREEMD